jgi:Protein of unknown function (DUF2853)
MSKFDEAIVSYTSFMTEKLEMPSVNEALLVAIAQSLGTAIYDADASLVACSDKGELGRIRQNFLLGRLFLEDSPELDKAIKAVCTKMGTSNRKKFRVVFYYLLIQFFGKESIILEPAESNLY